ncbi:MULTISPECIES: prepilin-type N-terminal cleavage/methylation domain-containing protein [unclassified Clostridium]|uniref:PilW family protein n=1 Tax=unclassified Clostridium TaxID=2614128 RepID=UPI0013CC3603|nr:MULTISPECIES: prepilin-type N-terminal cleavage/methylation domain-containing protein [unclassified Clostridium]MBN1069119.1 prepilin-type N-terminal cleavage/methylation domain-containing protein [Clostridium botulinum]MBZ9692928.1 prepilin-type N-terminal cleavage/methylation domain-containing protein [Clostridium sp. M14]NFI94677.1 prepilin-type N-terminal cleavage/methylation domain-containing protein [Clostridium botulinum]NFO91087.1 prepilin-type N-terminal cleavage/methylation domain-
MFRIRKKGFTLTELIIVMALTLVILGMIFQMFNTNNRIMSDVDIKSTLQNEGQVIHETLSKIGMQASSIVYNEENFGDDSEKKVDYINLNILNEDNSKSEFEIKKDGTELTIVENKINEDDSEKSKISSKRLTDNLKEIDIKYHYDKSAQVKFILSKKKGYSDIEYSVNVKFAFRNKY